MSCDPPYEGLDGCDEDPCCGGGDGVPEVLGEAAISIEPCEGALDHPATRQEHEALGGIGAFDDVDGRRAALADRIPELVTGIAAIGEDMARPGEAPDDRR